MNGEIIALIGVVIGGILTTLTQVVLWKLNRAQWKQEKRLEMLNLRREELREVFGFVSEELSVLEELKAISNLENRAIDPDEMKEVYHYKGKTRFILPQDVYEAYQNLLITWLDETKEEEFQTYKNYLNSLMAKHIRELDSKIDAFTTNKEGRFILKRLFRKK